MLAFKREAVALVVLAFYFLVLDQQTQESRLQQLLLLQHLKRSRRKRLILLKLPFARQGTLDVCGLAEKPVLVWNSIKRKFHLQLFLAINCNNCLRENPDCSRLIVIVLSWKLYVDKEGAFSGTIAQSTFWVYVVQKPSDVPGFTAALSSKLWMR